MTCINCGEEYNHINHFVICCGQIEKNIRHLFDSNGILKPSPTQVERSEFEQWVSENYETLMTYPF